jgi:hypothetical protein
MKGHHHFGHYSGPCHIVLATLEEVEDEETLLDEFSEITLIDEILCAWDEQYPIANLLKEEANFLTPIFVDYQFKKSTYKGTIVTQRFGLNPPRNRLTLRLSHDGFRYPKIDKSFVVNVIQKRYHRYGRWEILSDKFLEKMQTLGVLQHKLGASEISFRYNKHRKRIDILFHRQELDESENGSTSSGPRVSTSPFLKICFEHGAPRMLDKAEYWVDLYGCQKRSK